MVIFLNQKFYGNMRKYISILFTGVLLLASCQHDVIYEVDYNVTLDEGNTYYAGEPVKFNFTGDVENLVFYSGETGSQYKYKDRYEVAIEDVISANLHLDFQARYGDAGALEIWVSKDFAGINGTDAPDADRAAVKAMVEAGMPGWTKLDYQEGASTKWTAQDFPMNEYLENLCIAFHWCPKAIDKTQRTYWINGQISIEMQGTEPSVMNLTDLGFKSLMMNEEVEAYKKNAGNGSIRFDNASAGQICLQGVGANALPYAIDGWVFTSPRPLNKVANDRGTVIKNLQNYMHEYVYTWDKPGTYKVVFVGRNENYASASEQIHEFTITILEKR
jgi:hypothetical protein